MNPLHEAFSVSLSQQKKDVQTASPDDYVSDRRSACGIIPYSVCQCLSQKWMHSKSGFVVQSGSSQTVLGQVSVFQLLVSRRFHTMQEVSTSPPFCVVSRFLAASVQERPVWRNVAEVFLSDLKLLRASAKFCLRSSSILPTPRKQRIQIVQYQSPRYIAIQVANQHPLPDGENVVSQLVLTKYPGSFLVGEDTARQIWILMTHTNRSETGSCPNTRRLFSSGMRNSASSCRDFQALGIYKGQQQLQTEWNKPYGN